MTVEDAVIARLLTISAVTALVGTRVYLNKLGQSPTYPCIRVQNISDRTGAHLRGSDGMGKARIQVDAFAREVSGVSPKALVDAVAAAVRGPGDGSGLFGWQGQIGSPAFTVLSCLLDDKHEAYDPDELRVVTVSQDFMVTYRA